MAYDVVLHLDTEDTSILDLSLGNIENYLAALEDTHPCSVTLVANAGAVKLFTRDSAQAERIQGLAARGVAFDICANALRKHRMDRDALLDACVVVPAGVVELVRLQDAGFAYVKP